jgi:hypothetical protein
MIPCRASIAVRVAASRSFRYAAVGRWTARRIYTVQGGNELRQVRGQRAGVGDAVDGRVLTVQPPVDRPVPGIALGRFTLPERDGNGNRQQRGKPRQPVVLLVHILDCPVDAGQAHGHVVTESIQRVVRPGRGDRLARSAHRGTCPASNRLTRPTSVSISSTCIVDLDVDAVAD